MKQAERKVSIGATIEELAAGDVSALIGSMRYNAIKAKDEHPLFIKLKVAYEGISKGSMTVAGKTVNQVKRWYRGVIDELADVLNFGSAGLFEGHANKETRARLGEVLASFADDDDGGRRVASAIAYVSDQAAKPRIKSGELSRCSVEADVIIGGLDTDEPFIEKVEGASGIALAPPEASAGFEEAGVEAVIAELQDEMKGRVDEMANEKKPSELFNRNELLEDPTVKSLIDAGRETVYTELKTAKDEIATLKGQVAEKDKTIASQADSLKAAGASANAGRVGTLVDAAVKAMKLTTKEKDLIAGKLKKAVRSEDPAVSDDDLKKLVEDAAKDAESEALEYRKIYGKPADTKDETPSDKGADGDDDKDAGTGDDEDDEFIKSNPLAKAAG